MGGGSGLEEPVEDRVHWDSGTDCSHFCDKSIGSCAVRVERQLSGKCGS